MVLNVNFSEPLLVSSTIAMDFIDLVFLQEWLFRAKSDGFMLKTNYSLLAIEVPRQMASEADYKTTKAIGIGARNGLICTIIIPLIFMIFMSVSMKQVWALYNMLQLLVNLS